MSTGVRRSTRIRKMRSVVDMYAPSESAAITVTENASKANKTPPKASKKGKLAKGKTSRSKKDKVSARNANREASTSPEAPTAAVEDVTVRFSVEDDKENAGGASPVPGSPPTAKAKKGGRKGRAKAAKKSNTKAKAKTARRNTTRKSRTRRKSAGDQQTNDGDEAGEASDTNTGRRAGRRTGRKGTKERPQPAEDAEVKPDDVAAGNGESESGDVVAMDAVDTFTTPSPEKVSPSRTGTESEADEDEQSPVVPEARSPSPQVRRSTRLARKTVSVVDEVAALEPRKRSAKKVDGSKGSGKKRTRSSVAAADDGIADGESDAALVSPEPGPKRAKRSSLETGATADDIDDLLAEFDLEVEARCGRMLSFAQDLGLAIRNTLSVQLLKLPKRVRELPLSEFKEKYGGSIDAANSSEVSRIISEYTTPKAARSARRTKRATTMRRRKGNRAPLAPLATPLSTPARETGNASKTGNRATVTVRRSSRKTRGGRRGKAPVVPDGGADEDPAIRIELDDGLAVDLASPTAVETLSAEARLDAVEKLAALQAQVQNLMSQLTA